MNEQLKESLSAVIDDEADEFEIRRVLNEAAGDPELRGVWERYHLVRSVMRGEGLVVDRSISRFWSQVDDDQTAPEEIVEAAEAVAAPVHKPWAGWFGRGAGLAAVAGIVVALIVGIGGGEKTAAPQSAVVQTVVAPPQNTIVEAVAMPPQMVLFEDELRQRADHRLPPDQQRAQAYMLHHAHHVALNDRSVVPFVKVAAFESR